MVIKTLDPDPEPEPDPDSLKMLDPDPDSLVFRVTLPYQISSVLPVLIDFLRIRLEEKSKKRGRKQPAALIPYKQLAFLKLSLVVAVKCYWHVTFL